jgi:hypothetical protein
MKGTISSAHPLTHLGKSSKRNNASFAHREASGTQTRRRTRDSLRGARARWRFKSAVYGAKARASDLSDRGSTRGLPARGGLPNPGDPIALVVNAA